jgi:yersiniabactin nonribosomal peptide synthetase
VGFYKGKESILESQLKEYLSTKVPEYMIPVAFIRIEEFPKTGNGKIDRKELEELAKRSMSQQEQTGLAKRLPETKEEKEMAKIWKAVLSCEEPGATDNFFSHGGNSLKAIQLVNQINDTYQLQLSIQQVFEHATIEKLAALVLETVPENNAAEDTEDGEI